MAALTGTNLAATPAFLQGYEFTAVGTYTLVGTIANADTITWTNLLPDSKVTILDVAVNAPELDTSATPTGTIIVGNSDDDDGFIASTSAAVNLSNSLAERLVRNGNGALVNTAITNRSVILKANTAFATGAATGDITLRVRYRCGTI